MPPCMSDTGRITLKLQVAVMLLLCLLGKSHQFRTMYGYLYETDKTNLDQNMWSTASWRITNHSSPHATPSNIFTANPVVKDRKPVGRRRIRYQDEILRLEGYGARK